MANTSTAVSGNWYLIHSKPKGEVLAQENLSRQGYETYLPLMAQRRRRKGQGLVESIEPMFPRYLFIRLSEGRDNFAPIRSTIGVSSLVRFGGVPSQVPDVLIEMLKQGANAAGFYASIEPDLMPGNQVKVIEGVFAGYEAIYQASTSEQRVMILLDMLGKMVNIEIPRSYVETVVD